MKLYDIFLIWSAKILIRLLRMTNTGGTSLPGKLALSLDKGILKRLAEGKKIIAVTGTNGKTTTSRILAEILKNNGISFFTNKSGANLLSGLTTTFIENHGNDTDMVILEIDEAAFSAATEHFKPFAVIVTNFFRDQLDRYGELYSTLNKVKQGVEKTPGSILVLNADDSLCASIGREYPNPKVYFGFSDNISFSDRSGALSDSVYCLYCKSRYDYITRTIGHLGHFVCKSCGYERPLQNISAESVSARDNGTSRVDINLYGKRFDADIKLPAAYNIYNALAALSIQTILDLDIKRSLRALSTFEEGFGRMEKIKAGNKFINVMLVKNPTGFNSSLDYLISLETDIIVCFAINDNIADGTDISWLWDVDFEKMSQSKINYFICTGKRGYDMSLRLKYMDVPRSMIHGTDDHEKAIEEGLERIKDGDTLYILPTYTAMLEIRRMLQEKYDLKEFWK